MDLKLRLRTLWDDLQSSLWYRPAIYTLFALILALMNPWIDQVTEWKFYDFGADNARAVLSSIASSMLTVVTLTFSILMVSFTLASQQFSPRILRTFTRDKTSQHVLGIQIGTFLYSLLVMVRINDIGESPFIPLFSVLGAIGMAMLGIGAFIYFIDHISHSIRVNYVIANIGEQTVTLLHEERPEQATDTADSNGNGGDEKHEDAAGTAPSQAQLQGRTSARRSAAVVTAKQAGYIQGIATKRLLEIATKQNLLLEVACTTGDFVPLRQPLLYVHPTNALPDSLSSTLAEQFDIGTERTLFEDTLFGIRQLVDIALKALSPAVNDPTTAVNCLDHLVNILIQAAQYPDPRGLLTDNAGRVRVRMRKVTFAAMVELAFNQVRHYGCDDALVCVRVIDALAEIAGATDDRQRQDLLWHHIGMVSRAADRSLVEPHEREQINGAIERAAEQMQRAPKLILLDPVVE